MRVLYFCVFMLYSPRVSVTSCVPRIRNRIQRAIYQSSLKLCTNRPPVCPWDSDFGEWGAWVDGGNVLDDDDVIH